MSNCIPKSDLISRKSKALLVSAFAVLVVALSMYPSGASAGGFNAYQGFNLPGGAWTAGNGVVLANESSIYGIGHTTSSICVGPITHDGSGFHAPYGWACAPETREWNFTPITAAAGFYNPNPGTIKWLEVYASGL
jgi:hypothetical protein